LGSKYALAYPGKTGIILSSSNVQLLVYNNKDQGQSRKCDSMKGITTTTKSIVTNPTELERYEGPSIVLHDYIRSYI
jgi:hypothetical protein